METAGAPTVLTTPRLDRRVMFIGLPVVGAGLALALPVLARWMLSWGTGLPMRPAFWFLGGIDSWWKVLIAAALGALAGLAAAASAADRTATVHVSDAELVIEVGGGRQTIARDDIDAVFLDGKTLVGQDADSHRLFSAPLEASRDAIAKAFRAHGYRWIERDPFLDQYRPWRPGGDELPAEVNAVLVARETALRKHSITELHNLAQALQRLGYAVREEGTRQYWRPLAGERSGPTEG